MLLWRISNHPALDGVGGLRASGRWHSRGRRVVYLAENPAAALLEILVHLEIEVADLPARYRLLKIEAADDLAFETVPREGLPSDWTADGTATRNIGDAWLAGGRTALLRVPSALTPETWNMLLNPIHDDARRLRIAAVSDHLIDARLLGAKGIE